MAIPVWAPGQVLNAADINTWFVPAFLTTTGVTFTTTTPTAIPGMSVAVGAGSYWVHGQLVCENITTNIGQKLGWTGSFASGTRLTVGMGYLNNGFGNNYDHLQVVTDTAITTPAFTAGVQFILNIDGVVVFTAPDTFGIQGWEGGSPNTWQVYGSSWVTLSRVA